MTNAMTSIGTGSTTFDVAKEYETILSTNTSISTPVAAIQALLMYVREHTRTTTTMTELSKEIQAATKALNEATEGSVSVMAGCELFARFASRIASDCIDSDFAEIKRTLLERGQKFVDQADLFRDRIADLAVDFIQDGMQIMIHAYSRVVMSLLRKAAATRRFNVLVTEAKPTLKGHKAARELREYGIPAEVIYDCAMGHYMKKVNMVLVGAEGIVENGGLINQIGTFTMAVVAKSYKVPLYGVAESYKFVRAFPLDAFDLPTMSSAVLLHRRPSLESILLTSPGVSSSSTTITTQPKSILMPVVGTTTVTATTNTNERQQINEVLLLENHATIDYTPPSFISLLFTDLGILPPSSVSDELIKLYGA